MLSHSKINPIILFKAKSNTRCLAKYFSETSSLLFTIFTFYYLPRAYNQKVIS
jgi:hypothetical protein